MRNILLKQDIHGAGGGGGSTRAPKESPNTLRSNSTAVILDAVSAGPIKGLVNGLKSVYFEDTAFENDDGTKNFQRTAVAWALGEMDQDPLDSYSAAESLEGVGADVSYDTPIVRTVTNLEATSVRVTLRIPTLAHTDNETGDIKPAWLVWGIDVAADDEVYQNALVDYIRGKCTSPYEISYEIDLKGTTGPWNIKVIRYIKDSNSSFHVNAFQWADYTTIIEGSFMYPGVAYFRTVGDAKSFGGNVPTRKFEIYGRIIRVPSNYDPYTKTYDGVWDGTFIEEWTDCPPWIFYDMVTDRVYGLGEFLGDTQVNKWVLYEAARYCDELVPDGRGGFRSRFTFNGILTNSDASATVLAEMASTFRSMIFWAGGQIQVAQDRPKDPEVLVTPSNVIDGIFEYSTTSIKARHNQVNVAYIEPEQFYDRAIVSYDDSASQIKFGIKNIDMGMPYCTSRAEALAFAKWVIETEREESRTCTYRASLDHIFRNQMGVMPGMIVSIADPKQSGRIMSGRVQSLTDTIINLDRTIEFRADEEYRIQLTLPDLTIIEKEIIQPTGDAMSVELVEALVTLPIVNSVWVILSSALVPKPFRVVSVQEISPAVVQYSLVQFDPTKFERVEQGIDAEPDPYTSYDTGELPAPTLMTIKEFMYIDESSVAALSGAYISWTPPRDGRISSFDFEFKAPTSLDWIPDKRYQGAPAVLKNTDPGVWQFRVRSESYISGKSVWLYGTFNLLGIYQPPPDVQNFRLTSVGDLGTFTWDRLLTPHIKRYRIRYSQDVETAIWESAIDIVPTVPKELETAQTSPRAGTYMIKAVTESGIESVNEARVVLIGDNSVNLNFVEEIQEEPDFAGEMNNMEYDGLFNGIRLSQDINFLEFDNVLEVENVIADGTDVFREGSYTFSDMIDVGQVYTNRVTARINAVIQNLNDDIFILDDIFSVPDLLASGASDVELRLQMRTTVDDPDVSPTWTEWEDFYIGDYTFRAAQWRLLFFSYSQGKTPVVTLLHVTVDMPDRVVADYNIAVGTGGLSVTYDPAFYVVPSVNVTAKDMATGDRIVITNETRFGFDIIFRNSGGSAVARTMNYAAQGWGYER